jgi:hypothetical protein
MSYRIGAAVFPSSISANSSMVKIQPAVLICAFFHVRLFKKISDCFEDWLI